MENPLGFRFSPTDEELIDYLRSKLLGNDSNVHNAIPEIDVCKFEPWDLAAMSIVKTVDQEWFFLTRREYKYGKSKKINRATKHGFWKATGKDRNIKSRGTNDVIGTKKTLVYYEGRVPGVKGNWVIHEYHDVTIDETERKFVLCRLIKKAETKSKRGKDTILTSHEEEPSRYMESEHQNQVPGGEALPHVGVLVSNVKIMESSTVQAFQGDQYFPYSTQQRQRNENNIMQTPLDETIEDENTTFEATKEEDEFVKSLLTDVDVVF